MQPPQPVPALVQALTSASVVSPCSRIAWQICALLTLLHEQTCALSGKPLAPPPRPFSPGGTISSPGGQGSGSPLRQSASSVP